MAATVTLTVTEGGLRGRTFVYAERTTCILGRADGCEPQLPSDDHHRTVSRHHCLLDINPPDVRVRDFGSLNGTYLNGAKIGQRDIGQTPEEAAAIVFPEHDLSDGDEIKLGDTVLKVSIVSSKRCVGCGLEIPDRERVLAGADIDSTRCEACRDTVKPDSPDPTPILTPSRCALCGREAPDKRGRDPSGELCTDCVADPERVLRYLVELARAGDDHLSGIRGYTLLRELGRGGMGAVYLARYDTTGQHVALKVMLPKVAAHADARTRFLREIDVSRGLRHPHIVELLDAGTSHGTFFFTLEYCEHGSLHALVGRRGGTLAVDEAVTLAVQALDGLDHAHRRGVVHRDLSPQNILLAGEGAPAAKVTDFGLAKAFDQAGLSGLTRTGTVAGKPVFMPRQQVINFKHAQPDADVWALAACLYWALTGAHPRDFPARQDPWQVVLQTDPVPIRERDRAVPATLAQVIDHALQDRPTIGFATTAEFREALEGSL